MIPSRISKLLSCCESVTNRMEGNVELPTTLAVRGD